MQCVTPMFREYEIGSKNTVRIVPRSEVMQDLEMNPNTIRFQLGKMNSVLLAKKSHLIQTIPCGHCWACQLNNSAEWATRNMLETLEHKESYFLTLTYDDDNLPIPEYIDFKHKIQQGDKIEFNLERIENDGTWIDGSLFPDDVTTFMNSIRKHFERKGITGIKYFYCGEYGEKTKRPHYHMIIHGLPLDISQNYDYHIDTKFWKEHWKNPLIDQYWQKGMHDIALCEWSNAAYVARYTMKKISNEPNSDYYYAQQGKVKEYVRMSRRPGIGMKYYEQHKQDIYEHDEMIMKTVKGNTGSFKPPKAFDRKFKEEYPEQYEEIERRRKANAELIRKNSYKLSNYTDYEQLKMKAEKIATKAKMLPRYTIDE